MSGVFIENNNGNASFSGGLLTANPTAAEGLILKELDQKFFIKMDNALALRGTQAAFENFLKGPGMCVQTGVLADPGRQNVDIWACAILVDSANNNRLVYYLVKVRGYSLGGEVGNLAKLVTQDVVYKVPSGSVVQVSDLWGPTSSALWFQENFTAYDFNQMRLTGLTLVTNGQYGLTPVSSLPVKNGATNMPGYQIGIFYLIGENGVATTSMNSVFQKWNLSQVSFSPPVYRWTFWGPTFINLDNGDIDIVTDIYNSTTLKPQYASSYEWANNYNALRSKRTGRITWVGLDTNNSSGEYSPFKNETLLYRGRTDVIIANLFIPSMNWIYPSSSTWDYSSAGSLAKPSANKAMYLNKNNGAFLRNINGALTQFVNGIFQELSVIDLYKSNSSSAYAPLINDFIAYSLLKAPYVELTFSSKKSLGYYTMDNDPTIDWNDIAAHQDKIANPLWLLVGSNDQLKWNFVSETPIVNYIVMVNYSSPETQSFDIPEKYSTAYKYFRLIFKYSGQAKIVNQIFTFYDVNGNKIVPLSTTKPNDGTVLSSASPIVIDENSILSIAPGTAYNSSLEYLGTASTEWRDPTLLA